MNHRVKSFLYFASLVVAVMSYHTIENTATAQNNQLANNTIVKVSAQEALN